MNDLWNYAADVLLTGAFLIVLMFGLWHGIRTNWRRSAMGVHTMTTTIVLLSILGLNVAQRVLDLNLTEDAPWIRTITYLEIFAWGVYRILLFGHVQRTKPIGIFEQTWRILRRKKVAQ